ncbi:hypothetical protein B0H14DRAFT_3456687 [Mycena olivaceomarginata]|nr:hypothetical protein B0H14DRAFT_3456687 [Mycena olivaceomarginata]
MEAVIQIYNSTWPDVGDDSQTAFLRTRLKLRCIEHAAKARERTVQKKRVSLSSSDAWSDDIDVDDGGNEEDFGFDELYTRIMRNTARKIPRAYYMYSCDREIGSFDPDLDEPQNWEKESSSQVELDEATAAAQALKDDAELQAYLAEQAVFADFADIPADDLFSWSDIECAAKNDARQSEIFL